MESYVPLIRKLIVIGIWIYVGTQMLPAARRGERNGFLWYFIGLFAFYIPFLIIAFAPPVLMLIATVRGFDLSGVYNIIGLAAYCSGLSVGFACLQRVKTMASTARP